MAKPHQDRPQEQPSRLADEWSQNAEEPLAGLLGKLSREDALAGDRLEQLEQDVLTGGPDREEEGPVRSVCSMPPPPRGGPPPRRMGPMVRQSGGPLSATETSGI
jgi:hypothetical protein